MTLNSKNIGSDFEEFFQKYITEDSGKRRFFKTGAVRDTDINKPRYDLIPPQALWRVAMLYARGAAKYGENNWQKGIPSQQMLASAMRHMEAYRCGDDSEDHLAAVVWNVLALMQYEAEGRDTPVLFRDNEKEEE
jgi:hypothetical protein